MSNLPIYLTYSVFQTTCQGINYFLLAHFRMFSTGVFKTLQVIRMHSLRAAPEKIKLFFRFYDFETSFEIA